MTRNEGWFWLSIINYVMVWLSWISTGNTTMVWIAGLLSLVVAVNVMRLPETHQ